MRHMVGQVANANPTIAEFLYFVFEINLTLAYAKTCRI